MTFTIIIPARYASQRLPGKPLLDIAGKTMIQRVYEQASQSQASRVVVATDDERIATAVTAFGGDVVMTSPDHVSGTDRLQEAAQRLTLDDSHIVVNVQGDEPLLPPEVINQVAANLGSRPNFSAATLAVAIDDLEEYQNPNAVKVVCSQTGKALYFSRASLPFVRQPDTSNVMMPLEGALRHIGLYAYRVETLNAFVTWPESPLEASEKLEQLRLLSHDRDIHVEVACQTVPAGIDTQADLERVVSFLQGSQRG